MKNIEICTTSGLSIGYYVKIIPKWYQIKLCTYLWKSSKTNELYEVKSLVSATEFKTKEEAMLCAEQYLNKNKK